MSDGYLPIYALNRGGVVESIHWGAVSVVDVQGQLVAWYGDPAVVTFMRSSAKPFQVLPFLQSGGHQRFALTLKEIALMCASHSGSDEHVETVRSIQTKCGVSEEELLCGVHEPLDATIAEELRRRGEMPTPNRHNCSGKHSGMLAYSKMKADLMDAEGVDLPYIDPRHPIQQDILNAFAEMCAVAKRQVGVGIDGCSAPNFAVPLRAAAYAYARLCDPEQGAVQPPSRAEACRIVTSAMVAHPEMVAGVGRFDTRLMQMGNGRLVSKGGAEGYQAIGLMPGALGGRSPALGIALKIADGDWRGLVREAVAVEVLRQMGFLSVEELQSLSDFGPCMARRNWRNIQVGEGYPIFELKHS